MSTDRSPHVIVHEEGRAGLPYSKVLTASSLRVVGLSAPDAIRIAEQVEVDLLSRGLHEITAVALRAEIAVLLESKGSQYAASYVKWQAVQEIRRPLIVLLGGATGTGKSTLATRLAARLNISRIISTDAVRQVLRSVIPANLIPSLHLSSFEAGAAVAVPLPPGADPLLIGFRQQVSAVAVGIQALIERALTEGTDIIIEGVHLLPELFAAWDAQFPGNVIIPLIVTVSDEGLHLGHLQLRGKQGRGLRYLSAFAQIRCIQRYILEQASASGTPVLDAFDLDSALSRITELVVDGAVKQFEPLP
jgi:2-phosphoglycerate kinase